MTLGPASNDGINKLEGKRTGISFKNYRHPDINVEVSDERQSYYNATRALGQSDEYTASQVGGELMVGAKKTLIDNEHEDLIRSVASLVTGDPDNLEGLIEEVESIM